MSYSSTHRYETVYIIRPTANDKECETIHDKVDSVIKKFNGELDIRDDWGTRDMAYPIDHFSTGRYTTIVYKGDSGVVEEIERHFKISDDVIRFLTVSVDSDYDYTFIRNQLNSAEEEDKKRDKKERMGRGKW